MKISMHLIKLGTMALIVLTAVLALPRGTAHAAGEEIILSGNRETPLVVAEGQRVTLDLGPWNMTVQSRATNAITVQEGGELVIKGTTGQITAIGTGNRALVNYGTVTIQGGNFSRKTAKEITPVIENYGTLYIEGGSISGDSPYNIPIINRKGLTAISGGTLNQALQFSILNENAAHLLITGDARINGSPTIEAIQNLGSANISGGWIRGTVSCYGAGAEKTVLEITGGEIEADSINVVRYPSAAEAPEVRISGTPALNLTSGFYRFLSDENHFYTETWDDALAAISIGGGIFSAPVSPDYWTDTVTQVQLADGRYGFQPLTAENAAAKITAPDGSLTYYNTLQRAVSTAVNGSTVTLQAAAAAGLAIPEGRDLTIDLHGHTLAGRLTNGGALTVHSGTIITTAGPAVFLTGGSVFTAGDTMEIISETDSAIIAAPENPGQTIGITISEKARLSSPADRHLVEVQLPDGQDANPDGPYGDLIRQIPISLLHTLAVDPGKPPTCTETGLTDGTHCTVCGKDIQPQATIPAMGHTEEPIGAATAPTCTAAGLTAGSRCSICGLVLTPQQPVPPLGHTEAVYEAVAATCTEPGLTSGTYCSVCHTVIKAQETIPALGHTESTREAVAATCTEPGLTSGTYCSVCHTVIKAQETIPALGHTESTREAVAATCTEPRLTSGTYCSVCHAVIKAQKTIPPLGHTESTREAVAATCTEPGLTSGTYCSVCHTVIKAQETIPPLGHTVIPQEAAAPTCTETGLTDGAFCGVCRLTLKTQEVVPALGHIYGDWIKAAAATCGADGEETRTCLRNPAHKETRTIPAAENHVWDAGLVIRRPDYANSGLQIFTCTVCKATITESIPPLPRPVEPPVSDIETPPEPDTPPELNAPPDVLAPPAPGISPPIDPVLPETGSIPLASAVFADVPPSAWYDEAIGYVNSRGLMTGTTETSFNPSGKMTRAMLWTVLGRIDGADVAGSGKDWYAKAQAWSIERGISDGSLADGNVSREQLVTMLWRYLGEPDTPASLTGFRDAASVSGWSWRAVQWAVSSGLLQGDGDMLHPGSDASRAEVAAIFMRFHEKILS